MNPETPTLERPASAEESSRQMNTRTVERPSPAQDDYRNTPLVPQEVTQRLQAAWGDIQAGFVDEPRQAVRRADELVASAIKEIAETFARERSTLENQWDREGDVSTEDLRVALTRYRSFFHRLLSM